MAIAILEIQGPADSRSGRKADGTPWGPFFTQAAYVHGLPGNTYPQRVEFSVQNDMEAHVPGFYVVDASAFYMDKNQRMAVGFRRRGTLIPITEAIEQLTSFQTSKQQSKAA